MKSTFCRCHPAVNFIFFGGVIVFAMLLNHPLFLGISMLSSFAYAVKLKGKPMLKTFFLFLLPLHVGVVAINALTAHYGVTKLCTLWDGNSLTLESIVYGAVTGALVVITIMWFMCWNEVVTEDKFMHLFGKKMPHLALLVLMVLRFVPLYINQLKEVMDARKNAGLESEGKFAKIKNACHAVSGVVTWALEHSIETADSMKSRGYGLRGRTSYSRFTLSPADIAMIAVMIISIAVIAAGKIFGSTDASYNPAIQVSGATPQLIFTAVFYAFYCFLPIIFDIEEEIRWNRLYAKT